MEHRDDNGNLIDRSKFSEGICVVRGVTKGDGETSPQPVESLGLKGAIELCRLSNNLPLEKRSWVLRISFGDEDAD